MTVTILDSIIDMLINVVNDGNYVWPEYSSSINSHMLFCICEYHMKDYIEC